MGESRDILTRANWVRLGWFSLAVERSIRMFVIDLQQVAANSQLASFRKNGGAMGHLALEVQGSWFKVQGSRLRGDGRWRMCFPTGRRKSPTSFQNGGVMDCEWTAKSPSKNPE